MEAEKTTLYNYHKNLGAKFVSFAGYEMPIQYSEGIVKEHISTRTFAGFFDVSHMGQFYISGKNIDVDKLKKLMTLEVLALYYVKINGEFFLRDFPKLEKVIIHHGSINSESILYNADQIIDLDIWKVRNIESLHWLPNLINLSNLSLGALSKV